jgi:hypothetical protein
VSIIAIVLVGDSRREEIGKTQPQALTTAHEHENPNLDIADSEVEAIKNSV